MTQQGKDKECFVIAPIGLEGTPERLHSDEVFRKIISPSAKQCGYEAIRADQFLHPGIITHDIIQHIFKAELVIANLTHLNPNVLYELALCHTLEKPVIVIATVGQNIPFDLKDVRAIFFDVTDEKSVKRCVSAIRVQIHEVEKPGASFDNPISNTLELINTRQSATFTPRDVRQALQNVSDLTLEQISNGYSNVYFTLRRQGIITRGELNQLTTSKEILDVLRELYIKELLRPSENPLDPVAIAEWGGFLFVSSITEHSLTVVRNKIRMSGEYKDRHGQLSIISAEFGALDKSNDVVSILRDHIQGDHLSIKVSIHTLGGDPIPGTRKQLKVTYHFKEQIFLSKVVDEDDILELP